MTGIIAVLAIIVSGLTSDTPILASGAQFQRVSEDVQQLKKAFEAGQAAQTSINQQVAQNLDQQALAFQQSELERMQKERANIREIQNQIDKINEIRLRLKLPPIARP